MQSADPLWPFKGVRNMHGRNFIPALLLAGVSSASNSYKRPRSHREGHLGKTSG